ncbi:hypothetical protein TNCV_1840841 [Trichonephila clavipes]|nr:hypothetical protein TNCV_1840841 [Trichonephila clavipes]
MIREWKTFDPRSRLSPFEKFVSAPMAGVVGAVRENIDDSLIAYGKEISVQSGCFDCPGEPYKNALLVVVAPPCFRAGAALRPDPCPECHSERT